MATKYDIDFKKMIVSLYQNGEKVKDLTSEYGISDKNIYAWIKRYAKDKQTGISRECQEVCVNENPFPRQN
ncbi:transposase [Liquorilactobacillus vini]|uniref:transposase n=1 Tax=Liquorilactobacillus vini TaxID=238015 RepID=UPI00029A7276|nr:helix-turn-helix domain-containing protein [Liquorilactobacillus vini]